MKSKVISPAQEPKAITYPAIFRHNDRGCATHGSLILVTRKQGIGIHLYGSQYRIGSEWIGREWETDKRIEFVPDVTIRFTA